MRVSGPARMSAHASALVPAGTMASGRHNSGQYGDGRQVRRGVAWQ